MSWARNFLPICGWYVLDLFPKYRRVVWLLAAVLTFWRSGGWLNPRKSLSAANRFGGSFGKESFLFRIALVSACRSLRSSSESSARGLPSCSLTVSHPYRSPIFTFLLLAAISCCELSRRCKASGKFPAVTTLLIRDKSFETLSLKSHWFLLLMYLKLNSFLLVSTGGAGIFASNTLKISFFCCCSVLSNCLDGNEKASAVLKSSDAFLEDKLPVTTLPFSWSDMDMVIE